jgi:two-component system, NtrC family, response regulator AtoC
MLSRRALIIGPDSASRALFIEVARRLGLEAIHVDEGPEALKRFSEITPSLIIFDLALPDLPSRPLLGRLARSGQVPVIAVAEAADVRATVEAMRAGATDVLDKLASADEVEHAIRTAVPCETTAGENQNLSSSRYEDIFRHSQKMRALERVVVRLAALPTPVLIRGESGVGKECIAVAIHHLSGRSDRPFLKLPCGALPSALLEAKLHEIEPAALGGILFLDEVGEAPAATQARLLRIVSDDSIRVLAATSADMYRLVAAGLFRSDLYERLAVATIDVPPLRHRREEIAARVQRFLERFAREFHRPVPQVSEATADLLRTYAWPGNVRELEHIVKRWVVLGDEDSVREEIESRRVAEQSAHMTRSDSLGLRDIARRAAREAERMALEEALRRFQGNRAAVARFLKVSYKTILQKLDEAGLSCKRTA